MKITATTSRTYDIEPTWRWFKKGDQTNILYSEAVMVFQSLRVGSRLEVLLEFGDLFIY